MGTLKIALSKGRVAKQALEFFSSAGYNLLDYSSRDLIITDSEKKLIIYLVKSEDVCSYVDSAIVDLGIVGNDLIEELNKDLVELMDLDICKCSICLASEENFNIDQYDSVTIATKYPNIANTYLKSINKLGRIIKLNGSIEVAPLVGLSDCIIDIVETGSTLKANNLIVKDTLMSVSTRLITSQRARREKEKSINNFVVEMQRLNTMEFRKEMIS